MSGYPRLRQSESAEDIERYAKAYLKHIHLEDERQEAAAKRTKWIVGATTAAIVALVAYLYAQDTDVSMPAGPRPAVPATAPKKIESSHGEKSEHGEPEDDDGVRMLV